MTRGQDSGGQFPMGSHNAYDRYVQGLSDALRDRDWVYDPSFALASDSSAYEKVLRDPVAAHAIRFRRHLAAGTDWSMQPASDSDEDKRVAEIVEELFQEIDGFQDSRVALADAIFRGSSWALITGRRRLISVAGLPPMWWWVPERLVDVDHRRFRLRRPHGSDELVWELWSIARRAWEPLEHPEWFCRMVFEDREERLGYGRGLLDSLLYFQSMKSKTVHDAVRLCDRFAGGFIKVGINQLRGPDGKPRAGTGRDGESVASAYVTTLKKHLAEDVLAHDKEDDIELLTGFGEGSEVLSVWVNYFDSAQVMAILGSTVPTMPPEGGSFALAKEQALSTEALVQSDRERTGDAITRGPVSLTMSLNRAQLAAAGLSQGRRPRYQVAQQRREDPLQAAQIIAILQGARVRLRQDEVYSRTGFTPPAPGDEVLEPAADPAPSAVPGLGDLGGGLPGARPPSIGDLIG